MGSGTSEHAQTRTAAPWPRAGEVSGRQVRVNVRSRATRGGRDGLYVAPCRGGPGPCPIGSALLSLLPLQRIANYLRNEGHESKAERSAALPRCRVGGQCRGQFALAAAEFVEARQRIPGQLAATDQLA